MKQQEWDERCKPHAQEIEAISDPIKILNSDDALELFKVIAQELEVNHKKYEVMESDFAASLTEEETQEADTVAKYEKITQESKSKITMVPKTVQIIDYLDMKVPKKLDETTADLKGYAKYSDNATVEKGYSTKDRDLSQGAQEEGRVDHVQVPLCVHQGLREGNEAQQGVDSSAQEARRGAAAIRAASQHRDDDRQEPRPSRQAHRDEAQGPRRQLREHDQDDQ